MINFEQIKAIHLELSSACNAACPVCPRNSEGGYTVPWLKARTMTADDFKKIFNDEVCQQIEKILLCGNFGDPAFCSDLPEILSYMNEKNPNVMINMNTNGGIRSPQWWGDLAKSHSNFFVTFSVDGLKDTNHLYRRNVKWDRLIQNIESFITNGGQAIWEFLIFKHNEHQIGEAKRMSEEMGFSTIRFKKPFGFENTNTTYSSMRVLDENGDLDYYLYPPTDPRFRNTVFEEEKEDVNRYHSGNDCFPLEAYKKVRQDKIDYYEDVFKTELENFVHLDNTEISCMTQTRGEVYIDSNGDVHPCCFLGLGSQNVTLSFDILQYYKLLEENTKLNERNAKHHTLRNIIDNQTQVFNLIENSWNKKHEDGRMMCCSKMCVKDHSPKENLYL